MQRLAQKPAVRQFAIFVLVGGAATVVQYCALAVFVELAHAPETFASVLAYCCGAVISYTLNRRFTFQSKTDAKKTFAKFIIVVLTGLGFNTAIFAALVHAGWHYFLAQCAATALVLIWNYAGSRFFAFK
jgi:putative flippase GtrA